LKICYLLNGSTISNRYNPEVDRKIEGLIGRKKSQKVALKVSFSVVFVKSRHGQPAALEALL
jgi:hypothetical protein